MAVPAADGLGDAVDVALRVARRLGCTDDLVVLHQSNNVVARCGSLVLKVSTQLDMAERDVIVAAYAAARGGPALAPRGELVRLRGHAVSVWPYCSGVLGSDEGDVEAGRALGDLHASLVGVPIDLPGLAERFDAVEALLGDEVATSALSHEGRAVLARAVDLVRPEVAGSAVLHGEPHDRNRLRCRGSMVFIDFEATCTGPVEWDLAFLPDDIVRARWPEHDGRLRSTLRIGVSACVAAACWRHVTARPDDAEMRSHADHHLELVRRSLD